jgi:peptide/nickel transport system ATP-binding protein
MADRVAVMYGGRIVEAASSKDLFARPTHPYTQGLLDCIPSRRKSVRLRAIPGIVPSLIGATAGCLFRTRCSVAAPACADGEIAARAVTAAHTCRCIHALPALAEAT